MNPHRESWQGWTEVQLFGLKTQILPSPGLPSAKIIWAHESWGSKRSETYPDWEAAQQPWKQPRAWGLTAAWLWAGMGLSGGHIAGATAVGFESCPSEQADWALKREALMPAFAKSVVISSSLFFFSLSESSSVWIMLPSRYFVAHCRGPIFTRTVCSYYSNIGFYYMSHTPFAFFLSFQFLICRW